MYVNLFIFLIFGKYKVLNFVGRKQNIKIGYFSPSRGHLLYIYSMRFFIGKKKCVQLPIQFSSTSLPKIYYSAKKIPKFCPIFALAGGGGRLPPPPSQLQG